MRQFQRQNCLKPANSGREKGILVCMNIKTRSHFAAVVLGALLAGGPSLGWSQDSAKQDMKDAGHDTKTAAKDVGHGTKTAATDVGHGTKTGTKKAYNATKHGTKKVWTKTKNTTKGAADGAKDGAQKPPQ